MGKNENEKQKKRKRRRLRPPYITPPACPCECQHAVLGGLLMHNKDCQPHVDAQKQLCGTCACVADSVILE